MVEAISPVRAALLVGLRVSSDNNSTDCRERSEEVRRHDGDKVSGYRSCLVVGLVWLALAACTTSPPAPSTPSLGGTSTGAVPAGGIFPTLPSGSPLPSDAQCAQRVQRDPWEPRPQNTQANHTTPQGPMDLRSWSSEQADALKRRVTGNFTGTTDEIIQWASCKWGFNTDLDRAQAVVQTDWDQTFVGDSGDSKGIYQMRTSVWGGAPYSQTSTAFNADWALGLRRACYEGLMFYGKGSRGQLWGCVGVHFSGEFGVGDADYLAKVQKELVEKRWLQWPSATGGRPPTAFR